MRKTKIICTIGPACDSDEALEKLCLAGMNVARLNFSHGTHQEQQARLDRIKRVREKLGLPIAIMLDTKGPEYRIRTFENGSVTLREGDAFTFTTEQIVGDQRRVAVNYAGLIDDLDVGDTILLNNGLLSFRVQELTGTEARCRVLVGGVTSNNKSMSFPNKVMNQVYLSEQDKADLALGIHNGIDYIACSFVSCRQNILDIKAFLAQHTDQYIGIIAKIENQAGIDNMEEICRECDGIMVARGDLGVEVPFEKLPAIQKQLITKCRLMGKLSITATEMLESMIYNARPTRAEISDVANAVYDGTSAVMLSGETAAGKYPEEAVATMARIVEHTEGDIPYDKLFWQTEFPIHSTIDAISHATCAMAIDIRAKAIVACSLSGSTVRMVSRFRPPVDILGLTTSERSRRMLALSWGVQPILCEEVPSTDVLFYTAKKLAQAQMDLRSGDEIIITGGIINGRSGNTNLLKVETI